MPLEAAPPDSAVTAAASGAPSPPARAGAGTRARVEWYLRRLQCMSPQEVAWRTSDALKQRAWRSRQVPASAVPWYLTRLARDGDRAAPSQAGALRFAPLPAGTLEAVPVGDARRLVRAADEILAGRWEVLGVTRQDMVAPDWFLDPLSGRRAP